MNDINEARQDIARRTKRGISFICASIILWAAISVVWIAPVQSIAARNLLTFCCAAPLMPLAYLISRMNKAEFTVRGNPLNNLGLLFSLNQFAYLLIAIWAFAGAPERMVMIIAVIFGAHLMPFSWLYQSKAYMVMSVVIPVAVTVVGWGLGRENLYLIPLMMVGAEIVFSIWLSRENRQTTV